MVGLGYGPFPNEKTLNIFPKLHCSSGIFANGLECRVKERALVSISHNSNYLELAVYASDDICQVMLLLCIDSLELPEVALYESASADA